MWNRDRFKSDIEEDHSYSEVITSNDAGWATNRKTVKESENEKWCPIRIKREQPCRRNDKTERRGLQYT